MASRESTVPSRSGFPEDLIVEILRILEAKSVVRFRCVSKSWKSIVADPSFAQLRLNKRSRLLLFTSSEKEFFRTTDYAKIKIDIHAYPPDFRIWGSCHGIICYGVGTKDLNLWNPTSGEVRSLPRPPDDKAKRWRSRWFDTFGFGWDKSVSDYKVVRVLSNKYLARTEVEVLALKSNTWVEDVGSIDLSFDLSFEIEYLGGSAGIERNKIVYCKGALHVLANSNGGGRNDVVARFDLADQNWQKLLLPLDLLGFRYRKLGILGDDLCFCSTSRSAPLYLDVWVMKECGVESPWTKLTTLKDVYHPSYVPLSLTTDGGMIGIDNGDSVVHTNLSSGLSNRLLECRDYYWDTVSKIYDAVVYEETFVSLTELCNKEK